MQKGLTKYQPLIDFLTACTEHDLVLTFTEIEAILGAWLPMTAYSNSDYWRFHQHPHVRRWQALGWRARLDRRDRHNLRVHFTRHAEG